MSVFVREGQPYITGNLRKYNMIYKSTYPPIHPFTHLPTYIPIYSSKALFWALAAFSVS
jgi:hypothetical protein